jgi:hypothetical protein
MSKPNQVIQYLGAFNVEMNKTYDSVDIKTNFPDANMMKMKTEGVNVNINGTVMFPVSYDDETYLPPTSVKYIFSKDCTVVVGKYTTIT